jgi:hypothetical protein
MSRETENALLLLIGLSTAIIVITGSYIRYVKPSLLPWLAGAALLLIALALVAIVRDVQRGSAAHDDGHSHSSSRCRPMCCDGRTHRYPTSAPRRCRCPKY